MPRSTRAESGRGAALLCCLISTPATTRLHVHVHAPSSLERELAIGCLHPRYEFGAPACVHCEACVRGIVLGLPLALGYMLCYGLCASESICDVWASAFAM